MSSTNYEAKSTNFQWNSWKYMKNCLILDRIIVSVTSKVKLIDDLVWKHLNASNHSVASYFFIYAQSC